MLPAINSLLDPKAARSWLLHPTPPSRNPNIIRRPEYLFATNIRTSLIQHLLAEGQSEAAMTRDESDLRHSVRHGNAGTSVLQLPCHYPARCFEFGLPGGWKLYVLLACRPFLFHVRSVSPYSRSRLSPGPSLQARARQY